MTPNEESDLIYHDEDFKDGLMCAECPHVFGEGEQFHAAPYAFAGDTPITQLVCQNCLAREER